MAAPRPEHAHATARPATATPLPRPAHTTTGWRQDRRPVVSKRPLHRLAAAKMSPHIHIGPEPVLAAHARSLPAAGSRCPAGADSAPHSEQNFFNIRRTRSFSPLAFLGTSAPWKNGLFRLPSSPDFLSLGSFRLDLRIYRTSALLFYSFRIRHFRIRYIWYINFFRAYWLSHMGRGCCFSASMIPLKTRTFQRMFLLRLQ